MAVPYLPRHSEQIVARLGTKFRSVLVLGARQVGKTTLLKHLFPKAGYFLFDPVQDLYNARRDPDMFLAETRPPLILDEIQYVPEVLASLKRKIDQVDQVGQYFLTGSQNFASLRQVSESLAGRVVIVELWPLTLLEAHQIPLEKSWLWYYFIHPADLTQASLDRIPTALLPVIWKGGFPGAKDLSNEDLSYFFQSYLQTYVERDVRTVSQIRDMQTFSRFTALQSALTAQEVKHTHLGREVDISPATAKEWSNILVAGYQWMELPAYSGNLIRRLSHKPKGYFTDTGFACHLMRINSPDSLLGHPALGALFETYCVNEIYRTLRAGGKSFQLYHWRSAGGAEVDLIIEMDGILYPLEMKAMSTPSRRDCQGIIKFTEAYSHLRVAPGIVLHGGTEVYKIHENVTAIPWNSFCR